MTIFPSLAVYGSAGNPSHSHNTESGKKHQQTPNHLSQDENRLLYTALHQAVLACRFQQVYLLIVKCKAQVNSKDLFGRTPLMLCCLVEDIPKAERMMVLLLKSGANQRIKDNLGRTALAYACIQGRETLARYLFNNCTDFSIPDSDGNTPLHHNAIQGNYLITKPLVKYCRQYGSDIDKKNCLGYSPLLLACRYENLCSVAILLYEGGAITNQTENEYCYTPLQWILKAESRKNRLIRHRTLELGTSQPARHTFAVSPRRLERSETCLSTFYKEFTMNREISSIGEYKSNAQQFSLMQATTTIPWRHPTDNSDTHSWNESVKRAMSRSKTASSEETMTTLGKPLIVSDEDDTDWSSMSSAELFHCIKTYLEKPSESRISTANTRITTTAQNGQRRSRFLQQDAGELVRFSGPGRLKVHKSSTTCLRQLLEIYSDSFNVVKAAVPPPKLSDPSNISFMLSRGNEDSTNDMSIAAITATKRLSMAKRMSVMGGAGGLVKKK